jgi:hypothetical protein
MIYRNYRLSNNRDITKRFQRGGVNRIIINRSVGRSFVQHKAIIKQRIERQTKEAPTWTTLLAGTSFPTSVGNC